MEQETQLSGPLRTLLLEYDKTLDCVHCGLCLPVCPTYQETGRESSSPRGRIYAMRGVAEGRISLRPELVEEMYLCLACRACETACPAGVQYGLLVESMRAEIDAQGARSRLVRMLQRFVLRRIVASPTALRRVSATLRFYQRWGLRALTRASGILRLVPRLAAAERMLPELADPHRPPILVPAEGKRRGRVAFFTSCVMPELFGPVNEATVRVLARNGYEVQIPRGQRCCGALHAHAGDPGPAQRFRKQNRSVFHVNQVDAVIVNSAGCGAALKDPGDDLAQKLRDVSEFLHEVGLRAPSREVRLRVAYDDPCHLLHGQRVGEAPRAVLRGIPGLELFDLPGASECCGGAGIYSITQPEMSKRLLERKVNAIRATAPDVVATGNPACLVQIQAGVRAAGLDVEVLHPVELLDRAYADS